MHNPLDQFEIKRLIELSICGYDISFTNSSAFALLSIMVAMIFLFLSVKNVSIKKPGRAQVISEMIFYTISSMLEGFIGKKGTEFIPSIMTLFMFILMCNLLGMFPYSFTVTSHIAVTFFIATVLFLSITLYGILRHGLKFFTIFVPDGTPIFLLPLMLLIELFSYLIRPVTLSIRLSANMTAGHITLKVLASLTLLYGVLGVLPFSLLVLMTGFEFFIAILQSYIFTILTCAYLNDAVNLH